MEHKLGQFSKIRIAMNTALNLVKLGSIDAGEDPVLIYEEFDLIRSLECLRNACRCTWMILLLRISGFQWDQLNTGSNTTKPPPIDAEFLPLSI